MADEARRLFDVLTPWPVSAADAGPALGIHLTSVDPDRPLFEGSVGGISLKPEAFLVVSARACATSTPGRRRRGLPGHAIG